jgi:hypothetical protein
VTPAKRIDRSRFRDLLGLVRAFRFRHDRVLCTEEAAVLARRAGVGLALLTATAGVIGSDPYDGAIRGLFEGAGCLAGFATLGRYFGLHARE